MECICCQSHYTSVKKNFGKAIGHVKWLELKPELRTNSHNYVINYLKFLSVKLRTGDMMLAVLLLSMKLGKPLPPGGKGRRDLELVIISLSVPNKQCLSFMSCTFLKLSLQFRKR